MATKKDPAFLFYSKDWLEGTAEMTPSERGIYITLLAHQHQKGSLPCDIDRVELLAAASHDEFIRAWPTVSAKFQRTVINAVERLLNVKLADVMVERADKGHRNKIIGTFAAVLRTASLNKFQYSEIRKLFKVDDWITETTEKLTERLTEWLQERLKSIENEDAIEDIKLKGGMGGDFDFLAEDTDLAKKKKMMYDKLINNQQWHDEIYGTWDIDYPAIKREIDKFVRKKFAGISVMEHISEYKRHFINHLQKVGEVKQLSVKEREEKLK